jgi:hypothetical protein
LRFSSYLTDIRYWGARLGSFYSIHFERSNWSVAGLKAAGSGANRVPGPDEGATARRPSPVEVRSKASKIMTFGTFVRVGALGLNQLTFDYGLCWNQLIAICIHQLVSSDDSIPAHGASMKAGWLH